MGSCGYCSGDSAARGFQNCHSEERSDVGISQYDAASQESPGENATGSMGRRGRRPLQWYVRSVIVPPNLQLAWRSLSAATDAIGLYVSSLPCTSCKRLPEIATAPAGPCNDTSGKREVHQPPAMIRQTNRPLKKTSPALFSAPGHTFPYQLFGSLGQSGPSLSRSSTSLSASGGVASRTFSLVGRRSGP